MKAEEYIVQQLKELKKWIEMVLSPKQLKTISFEWEKVAIEGLARKNFERIRVIDN